MLKMSLSITVVKPLSNHISFDHASRSQRWTTMLHNAPYKFSHPACSFLGPSHYLINFFLILHYALTLLLSLNSLQIPKPMVLPLWPSYAASFWQVMFVISNTTGSFIISNIFLGFLWSWLTTFAWTILSRRALNVLHNGFPKVLEIKLVGLFQRNFWKWGWKWALISAVGINVGLITVFIYVPMLIKCMVEISSRPWVATMCVPSLSHVHGLLVRNVMWMVVVWVFGGEEDVYYVFHALTGFVLILDGFFFLMDSWRLEAMISRDGVEGREGWEAD